MNVLIALLVWLTSLVSFPPIPEAQIIPLPGPLPGPLPIAYPARDGSGIHKFAVTVNTGATVPQADSAAINSTKLLTASGVPGATITYTVTSGPTYGDLHISGAEVTTFTQTQVTAGSLYFLHDSTANITDSFAFSVTDGHRTLTGKTFSITVTPGLYGLVCVPNDYAASAAYSQVLAGATLEAWIKPTFVADDYRAVIARVGQVYLYIRTTTATTSGITGDFYIGGVYRTIKVEGAGNIYGAWHHIATTYDGANMRVFLDGVQLGSPTAQTGVIDTVNVATDVGRSADYVPNSYFKGTICGARIWNGARTAAEITALMYTPFLGPTTDLTVEYVMTPGSGTTVTDYSGNARTLTFGAGAQAPAWTVAGSGLPPTGF